MKRGMGWLKLVAPVALLTLAACASSFQAKVNRFQAMPAPQGQSFYVTAADPADRGSLEFSQYASLVAQKLGAYGYQPAPSADAATLIVALDYGVDQGREKLRTVPGTGWRGYDPFWGPYWGPAYWTPYYYGRRHFIYGFHDPFLFGPGYDEVESYTVYTSGLNMKISRRADGQNVFEGKAEALSRGNDLTYLVPNLIEAMFTGFPGNSGETVKITVPPPAKR